MSEDPLRQRIEALEAELLQRESASLASNATAARFRAMVENGSEAMWLFGPDSIVTYASPSTRHILGIGPAHVVGTVASLWVHAADRPRVERETRALFREPTRGRVFEFRALERDGVTRWVECTATNMLADPAVGAIVLNVRDITDRKASENKVREAELRFRKLFDAGILGVTITATSGTILEANDTFLELLGYTREDLEAGGLHGVRPVRPGPGSDLRVAGDLESLGRSRPWDDEYVRKDGARVPVLVGLARLDEHRLITLVIDLTARKRAEERGAAVVNTALEAVVVMDEDGRITEFNPAAERTFGFTRARAVGATLAETIIPARLREPHLHGLARLRKTGVGSILGRRIETWALRADGTEIPVELSVSRVGTSTTSAFVGFIRDLSEKRMSEAALRRSEEELRQAQKMEAIGSLAGGVAHDFNNLLTVILSYTALLVEGTEAGDPIRADLEEVQGAATRATELTRQLLAFSRKQILAPVVMDLNEIVGGVQKMLARLLGEDVGLSLHTSTHPCPVNADPGQIEQVIMNLVVNARDAMPVGGSITIETANLVLDAPRLGHAEQVPAGRYAMIAVTDTGTGMDDATVERIFEPFFTTKEKSKGTGLGLSTVYGIIQQSGGHILVRSAIGKGTTFEVYLPRNDGDVETLLPVPPLPAARQRGTETILLVEDEEPVRLVVRAILRKHGYHVLEAQNGGEAFLLSEQHAGTIHLLLTDMVMPRMNGRQLAERLAMQRPEMKVLVMSGYTEDDRVRHGVHDAEIAFLQKPITPAALLNKVRQVFDGHRAGTP